MNIKFKLAFKNKVFFRYNWSYKVWSSDTLYYGKVQLQNKRGIKCWSSWCFCWYMYRYFPLARCHLRPIFRMEILIWLLCVTLVRKLYQAFSAASFRMKRPWTPGFKWGTSGVFLPRFVIEFHILSLRGGFHIAICFFFFILYKKNLVKNSFLFLVLICSLLSQFCSRHWVFFTKCCNTCCWNSICIFQFPAQ